MKLLYFEVVESWHSKHRLLLELFRRSNTHTSGGKICHNKKSSSRKLIKLPSRELKTSLKTIQNILKNKRKQKKNLKNDQNEGKLRKTYNRTNMVMAFVVMLTIRWKNFPYMIKAIPRKFFFLICREKIVEKR